MHRRQIMITAGIDCGAKYTKTVLLNKGKIIARSAVATGFHPQKAADASLAGAIQMAGVTGNDIGQKIATGSGKSLITIANATASDMKAMSRGAFFLFPDARTVVDVGAEEGRAAKLDDSGNPIDFAVNGQCAAGGGAFIEAMARALETPLEELGPLALTTEKSTPINAQCVIFAESEVVGLIHEKIPKNEISKAIHDSMANRIGSIIHRIGIHPDVVLIGGVAHNPGFLSSLKRELKIDTIWVPDHPEFVTALGAALIAAGKID